MILARSDFFRRLVLLCVLCGPGISSCRARIIQEEPALPALSFTDKLQEVIDQVLPAGPNTNQLGISAAVKLPDYSIWTGVSGISHPGTPITAEMMFDVGSIQKSLEAVLVLRLAEENRLSLEDPISKYLPAYPNVDGRVTIRQLLNHTSGIFNVFEHPDFPWARPGIDYSKRWELEEVISAFVREPYGLPGEVQHYSSTNYLLLTGIIEEVTGNSVPDEIEQHLLRPLELDHTFISMGEWPSGQYAVAHPWVDMDLNGIYEDLYGIPLNWKASMTHPVMFSTPEDLVRWTNALFHESVVLNPSALADMLTYPDVTILDPDGGVYGLGVVDYTQVLGLKAIGHGGSSLGYSAAALYLPEYGASVAWAINTGEGPPELASQIMSDTWTGLSEVIQLNQPTMP